MDAQKVYREMRSDFSLKNRTNGFLIRCRMLYMPYVVCVCMSKMRKGKNGFECRVFWGRVSFCCCSS